MYSISILLSLFLIRTLSLYILCCKTLYNNNNNNNNINAFIRALNSHACVCCIIVHVNTRKRLAGETRVCMNLRVSGTVHPFMTVVGSHFDGQLKQTPEALFAIKDGKKIITAN